MPEETKQQEGIIDAVVTLPRRVLNVQIAYLVDGRITATTPDFHAPSATLKGVMTPIQVVRNPGEPGDVFVDLLYAVADHLSAAQRPHWDAVFNKNLGEFDRGYKLAKSMAESEAANTKTKK